MRRLLSSHRTTATRTATLSGPKSYCTSRTRSGCSRWCMCDNRIQSAISARHPPAQWAARSGIHQHAHSKQCPSCALLSARHGRVNTTRERAHRGGESLAPLMRTHHHHPVTPTQAEGRVAAVAVVCSRLTHLIRPCSSCLTGFCAPPIGPYSPNCTQSHIFQPFCAAVRAPCRAERHSMAWPDEHGAHSQHAFHADSALYCVLQPILAEHYPVQQIASCAGQLSASPVSQTSCARNCIAHSMPLGQAMTPRPWPLSTSHLAHQSSPRPLAHRDLGL